MLMPSIFGDSLFDDWFDFRMPKMPDVDQALYGKHARNLMKTDVQEKDGNYEIAIDLPGFKKEDVHASLENGYLTISTDKSLDKEEKDEDKKYIRRERYVGAMSRSFYVGSQIRKEDINAEFRDGVLHLTMPKEEPKQIAAQNKYLEIK